MNNKTNILDSFTLLFAKLYAENVINKDLHKDAVASFMDATIKRQPSLAPWIFATAGIAVSVIAGLVVSNQSLWTVRQNPLHVLK